MRTRKLALTFLGLSAILSIASSASSASADEPTPWNTNGSTSEPPSSRASSDGTEPPAPRRWYGYQTLTADGLSFGLLGLAAASDGQAVRPAFATSSSDSTTSSLASRGEWSPAA